MELRKRTTALFYLQCHSTRAYRGGQKMIEYLGKNHCWGVSRTLKPVSSMSEGLRTPIEMSILRILYRQLPVHFYTSKTLTTWKGTQLRGWYGKQAIELLGWNLHEIQTLKPPRGQARRNYGGENAGWYKAGPRAVWYLLVFNIVPEALHVLRGWQEVPRTEENFTKTNFTHHVCQLQMACVPCALWGFDYRFSKCPSYNLERQWRHYIELYNVSIKMKCICYSATYNCSSREEQSCPIFEHYANEINRLLERNPEFSILEIWMHCQQQKQKFSKKMTCHTIIEHSRKPEWWKTVLQKCLIVW